jgi:hypothetical protein
VKRPVEITTPFPTISETAGTLGVSEQEVAWLEGLLKKSGRAKRGVGVARKGAKTPTPGRGKYRRTAVRVKK